MSNRILTAAAAALVLSSPIAGAAPPAGSPYFTDPQQSQVQDATSQSIGQVNMITCIMSSMRPDALVNKGPYNALIDQNVCNAAKQSSASNADSSGSSAQAPNYMAAVVNSTRASNSDPMIVSAWLSLNQQGTLVTIYAHISATEAPSESDPYGAFRLDYCGKSSSGACVINGFIQAGNGTLSHYEADEGGGSGGGGSQITALALSSVGTSSGGGSVDVTQSQNGQSQTQSFNFAYDSSYYYREDGSNSFECFSRDASDPATVFSVGQYGLYDASSGEEVTLNSGFPIQYSVANQSYQGYVGYYGLSTQAGAPAPASGTLVKKVDYQNGGASTASYTLVTHGGVLARFTRQTTTLKLIDRIQLQVFVNDVTGSSLPDANTSYLISWSEASQQFIATGEMQCGSNGCQTGPLSNGAASVAIEPSFWSSGGLQGWSQSLGGGSVFVALNAPATPLDATPVTYYTQDLVYPDDPNLPAALYCVANCPTAATLQSYFTQSSGSPVASPFLSATFNAWLPTTSPIAYALSGNVLTGGDGSSTPALYTSSAAYQQYPQYQNGVSSGHLVASLADAACGTDPNTAMPQYCDWTMAAAAVYYQWQTGPNNWNQFTAIKDSSGAFAHFDAPFNVTFNVPANTSGNFPYGNYAGTTMILQYGGFGNLWGIPGSCVSSLTNQPIACNDPSGTALYVAAFEVPYDPSATPQRGVVTMSSGGSTTTYLVKWLNRQILLAQKPVSTCTNAGLSTSSAALPSASGLADPSDPSSAVYNGVEPTVSSAPRVIQGQVMY
ncbi:MAG TPA: hypothetical protein VKT22_09700 [Steroidobacteraceae bacterium]|nr:hypothetical protein [Steroidobacteraceae bacterium]